ncbi:hypothetical protein [Colwellia piezophila]|uniref:hypothetical protein n=1 Tax=Colwellia piezophila TaxID=211668 RepID=UPI0003730525|nr:hypothetical protein [Colwellia piezophila]
MWFFKRKKDTYEYEGITFYDQFGNNYQIQSLAQCTGVVNGKEVCTFEFTLTSILDVDNHILKIFHFAFDKSKVEDQNVDGEECLREIAKLISQQNTNISIIRFDLSRTTSEIKKSNKKLQDLADAREVLLKKVKTKNVKSTHVHPTCHEVVGDWHKADWFIPKSR